MERDLTSESSLVADNLHFAGGPGLPEVARKLIRVPSGTLKDNPVEAPDLINPVKRESTTQLLLFDCWSSRP